MKLYMLLHYEFTGVCFPGIEYIDMQQKTEEEFQAFLEAALLYVVTFSSSGMSIYHCLKDTSDFYNALYQDFITDMNYIICCVEN